MIDTSQLSKHNHSEVVAYSMPHNSKNEFFRIVNDLIMANGYRTVDLNSWLKGSIGRRREFTPVIAHFWDEAKGRTTFKVVASYCKLMTKISLTLLLGGRIVYFVHNIEPHENTALSRVLSLRLRRLLCRCAAAIVYMCDDTLPLLRKQLGERRTKGCSRKLVKIPLPSYRQYYPEAPAADRKELGVSDSGFICLFCGLIRPYKNIELILDIARELQSAYPDMVFYITGESFDIQYREQLAKRASGLSNVVFRPSYLPDAELVALVKACDLIIAPLDQRNALNSATLTLAFSYGKTAVCPVIGTADDAPDGLVYTYRYENDAGHRSELKRGVLAAYGDWANDKAAFRRRGELLEEYMEKSASPARLEAIWGDVLSQIASAGAVDNMGEVVP